MLGFIWHIIQFFFIPVTFDFFSLHFPIQTLTLLLQAAQISSKNVADDPDLFKVCDTLVRRLPGSPTGMRGSREAHSRRPSLGLGGLGWV